MSSFDRVTKIWRALKYMDEARGQYLRELIRQHKSSDILELGFFQGKSSAYLAAILEDEGRGHLTTIDVARAKERHPNIEQVLERVGLSHRVTPIYAERSYTWEMGKLLAQAPREKFDLCYLDAGHTWDTTGFGFLLTDMLLRPGGIVVLDDLDWNMNDSMARLPVGHNKYQRYSEDERAAKGVRMVWDTIVPRLGYQNLQEKTEFQWGIAQKPRG